jgi:hypothetical protein
VNHADLVNRAVSVTARFIALLVGIGRGEEWIRGGLATPVFGRVGSAAPSAAPASMPVCWPYSGIPALRPAASGPAPKAQAPGPVLDGRAAHLPAESPRQDRRDLSVGQAGRQKFREGAVVLRKPTSDACHFRRPFLRPDPGGLR